MASVVKRGAGLFLVATGLFVSVSAAYACWTVVTTAPYFGLSSIKVAGNENVPAEEIISYAGIGEGTNIFSFDIREVGRRIEEIPWVREVSMEREFPDSLRINIVERRPVALVNVGGFYYLDDEGYIFAAADGETGWDYPVLTGIDKGRLLEGDAETFALLEKGVLLLNLLSVRESRLSLSAVSELSLDREEGVTLFTVGGGIPIHLGSDGFEKKLVMAEKVLSDLGRKGIRPVRVEADFEDRVLVKVAI